MKSKTFKSVSALEAHTDAVIKAEAAVVRAARKLHRLGPEHPAFWHHYWHAYTNAVARLEKLEGRKP